MILNMPVNSGVANNSGSQGQNEYANFLKRKYSERETEHCSPPNSSSEFEAHKDNWKKRHMEREEQTNYIESESAYSQQPYKSTHHNSLTSEPLQDSEAHDASAGAFNIIANSSFINDLFAYDANLIVPVSVNALGASVLAEQPIFSTPSTVCANATVDYENSGDHWQASDLLELDHRYNSSLQTEISQLHPTVNLKSPQEMNSLNANTRPELSQQQQQQQRTQFLLPPKTISQQTSPITDNKHLGSSNPAAIATTATSPPATSANSFSNDNPEQDCDFEDKNLSWLLNFKFDEFPHLNPDMAATANTNSHAKTSKSQSHTDYSDMNSSTAPYASSSSSVCVGKSLQSNTSSANGSVMSERSKSPKNSSKTGKKFEELVLEVTSELDGNDMTVAENVVIEESASSHRVPKKPPFTYTELIEYALEDKGELTVSGIYQWISDRFPFYKSNDDRWKNSVRHNLSINPHFRKGHKAPQGAGHLWTISSGDSAENVLAWEHKKQRLDLFFKMESINRERLEQHHQKQQQERLLRNGSGKHKHHIDCQQDQCLYDEAAVAAAAIQQEMLQQNQNNNDASIQNQNSMNVLDSAEVSVLHDLPYNDLLTDEELRKTAGQILNGIHREVEVQSVNQTLIGTYQDVLLDNDYLNPIHKDVVVNESGLRHSSQSTVLSAHCHSNHSSSSGPYYVTEIDPMELGIQISSSQHHHNQHLQDHHHHHHNADPSNSVSDDSDVVLFNDEFNLNYFTYNPSNDIVA